MKKITLSYNTLSASQLNKLYLFNSLNKIDYDTSKLSYEHLNRALGVEKVALHIEEVSSKSQLIQSLRDIVKHCRAGVRPIIQFDMHGNTEGIEIAQSREIVTWTDILPLLTKIHLASRGNLTVVFAACEAAAIINSIRINNPSPFFGMIAPKHKILESSLAKDLIGFYQTLFTEHRFVKASDLPEDQYYVYREDEFVLENLVIPFLQSKCNSDPEIREKIGATSAVLQGQDILNPKTLRETLLTDVLSTFPYANITHARNIIKSLLKNIPSIVISCATNFVGNFGVKRELKKSLTRYFNELFN